MSQVKHEVEAANKQYAAHFTEQGLEKLPLPPGRKFAILTCMDARLVVSKFAGLKEGDAHVIRNAGGRASDDAIRSLIISTRLLGTETWFVIHHTDCGMVLFDDAVMSDLLSQSTATHTYPALTGGAGPGSAEGKFIRWLTIKDEEGAVREDVHRIANHPLTPKNIKVYGYIYDVRSGLLKEVQGAKKE